MLRLSKLVIIYFTVLLSRFLVSGNVQSGRNWPYFGKKVCPMTSEESCALPSISARMAE